MKHSTTLTFHHSKELPKVSLITNYSYIYEREMEFFQKISEELTYFFELIIFFDVYKKKSLRKFLKIYFFYSKNYLFLSNSILVILNKSERQHFTNANFMNICSTKKVVFFDFSKSIKSH